MSVSATPRAAGNVAGQYHATRLFIASALALTMAGINAALRANTASDLQRMFLDPIDKVHSAEMIASILGLPFLGFAVTIAIGSPLLDYIGMGLLLPLSGCLLSLGMLMMIFAGDLASGSGIYTVLWVGALVAGIGWGLVETVVNPLIASLYPDNKTRRLNAVHAWWPGGLVIGGLLGVGMSHLGLGWQMKLGIVFLPAIALVALCAGMKFPPTERAAAGVTTKEMFRELANPLFFILFASMFLTAASELAPGQWVDLALSRTVHMPGILLLVYVSGLMFLMRNFAGPLVHKFSSIGVLWLSCLGAALGLVRAEHRELTGHRAAGRHALGNRRVLHVAHHAGNRFRTIPARRRAAHGLDGNRGNAIDPIRAADHGIDLRPSRRSKLAGGDGGIQRAAARPRTRSHPGHRRADFLPRCRAAARDFAAGLWRNLVLRSLPRRVSSTEAVAAAPRWR